MKEWPRTIFAEYISSEEGEPFGREVNVIPADLARELYEALGAARAAGEKCYPIVQGWRATQALVRYEEEIGE